MRIPTEPIGSIPRPLRLIEAVATGDGTDPKLDSLYDEAVRDTIERFEATGSPVITDGERIWIDAQVSLVADAEGRRVGILVLAHDITERKRTEEALREADRRKDEFLALLAHELRNPLAPLRNGSQLMRLAAGDARAVADARGIMERQLGHMVRLIDDLLDVSRINRSNMELRRSRVLLADVLSSAVETDRPLIDDAGHTLDLSLPSEPVALDADLTAILQAAGDLGS